MSAHPAPSVSVRRISPAGEHCFFGYYDLPAADAAGRHLFHQVGFRDRIPTPADPAVLAWAPLPAGAGDPPGEWPCVRFAETRAWNFQQGALLQWLPAAPDTCLYNVFEEGQFGACLHNVRTGVRRRLPLPAANVSSDGTKALCVNMARLFDFRPGYGYEELPDPFAAAAAPPEDGVFLMDLATGGSRLLVSLAEVADFLAAGGTDLRGRKILVNHITFNPSGTRYLFLLRAFPRDAGDGWATCLLTGAAAGGGLRHHPVWGGASHYCWRDDDELLIYAIHAAGGPWELGLVHDATGARRLVDPAFFRSDGHCSYSPDRRWMLYDSYPDAEHRRALQLYSPEREQGWTLDRLPSEPHARLAIDLRCDLHPRWMPGGRAISFDSIHEGHRGVYWADVGGIVGW